MIIKSFLDTDWYKITMGQVVFRQFPDAAAHYTLSLRDHRDFPPNFQDELQKEINGLASLSLTDDEASFLASSGLVKKNYLEWLRGYRFDPSEVKVGSSGAPLTVDVEGPWYRTIYWEVPLMAIISELFFRMSETKPDDAWRNRLKAKTDNLVANKVEWADFGTRRRFSFETQNEVVAHMAKRPGFGGTSNPHLAMAHGVSPIGTMAHEGPMAMQAAVGFASADSAWLDAWVREYQGQLDVALTDTLTTKGFLRGFTLPYAKLFRTLRQDSGDPVAVGESYLKHLEEIGVGDASIVFSDGLNDERAVEIAAAFKGRAKVRFGIGTFLTNDVGAWPINMVIKLTSANFGKGWRRTVKLSDKEGKRLGLPADITRALYELGLDDAIAASREKKIVSRFAE